MKANLRTLIVFAGLIVSFNSFAVKPAPALPNQKIIYIHQTSVATVHPNPQGANEQLGDLVVTSGTLSATEDGPSIGSYNTQKTVIGFNGTNAIRSNLVFFNIAGEGRFNGTLYVEGVNETTKGQTHAAMTQRPIIGGTGRYTAARGSVETEALSDVLLKATFSFYR